MCMHVCVCVCVCVCACVHAAARRYFGAGLFFGWVCCGIAAVLYLIWRVLEAVYPRSDIEVRQRVCLAPWLLDAARLPACLPAFVPVSVLSA